MALPFRMLLASCWIVVGILCGAFTKAELRPQGSDWPRSRTSLPHKNLTIERQEVLPRRRELLVFNEQGFWQSAQVDLSETDTLFFRDACAEKPWTSDKLVVVAGRRYDSAWLAEFESSGVQYLVYQNDDPSLPFYFEPHANEAGAYFLFILNYYHCLPQHVAFIHGHRDDGWHQIEMPMTLRNLDWEAVPGYTDLNRKTGYKTITLDHKERRPPMDPIATGEDVYNGTFSTYQILEGKAYPFWFMHLYLHEVAFARAWDHFFGPQGFGPMPEKVVHICCGQFAATRDAIQTRSREFYQEALMYMRPTNNDIRGNHQTSRQYVVGDMFSVFYGIIFGKPALYAKEASDCVLFNDCTNYIVD